MEFELISWKFRFTLQSIFLLILSAVIFLPFFSIFLHNLLTRPRIWCNCDICQSYLTLSWTKNFHNLCDWYTHLLKNSPTKTIHIHVLRNTITANPNNVEYILKTRFENYPKGKPFSTILGDFLGRGIFNVDGDLWRFQKTMASLELDRLSIRSYAFEIFETEIHNRLIPLLTSVSQDGVVLDLQDVFRRFSFDSICRFSFGLDPRCLEMSLKVSEFAVAFDLASKLSAERAMNVSPLTWKMKRMFNIGSEKKMKGAIKIINLLAQGVIEQKRKVGFSTDHRDLLSRFMRTVKDDTYLRDIVVSFLLAGRDTVAAALTSLFWLLAKHPEVDQLIRAEADRVLGPNQEVNSFDQIRELNYLHAAVHESMRIFPPIQFDSKFCQEDDVLPDGAVVKGGTRVTYHSYAMGRMENLWGPDCLEFKPERWLRDGVFTVENPFKYPVFQGGFRVCLGKEMALIELKCVTLSLLRRFQVELVAPHHTTPKFSPGLTATFNGGLPVLVRERGIHRSPREDM